MASLECRLTGDAAALAAYLDEEIVRTSQTARLEHASEHRIGEAVMVVRTYERYSAMGGNRVSLSVSILGVGEELALNAVAAGGSQAVFFKVNTVGEEAFLDKLRAALDALT